MPTTYNAAKPTSLTWILHSLGANLNQYGGVAPTQLQEECQQRESICATTEGFSDGQWYYGAAQVDFWDVWHQLAERLRPRSRHDRDVRATRWAASPPTS